jgi:hypothetical protein
VPASEVKFASLGNDPERFKAMLSGLALATVISIEFLPMAEQSGIKLVARGSDVMPKYQRLCTVTTGKLIAARRNDVIGFLTAQMQGYRHALAHPDEEIRIAREITGMKPDDPRPEFMFKEASRPATGISTSWSRPGTWRSPTTSPGWSTPTFGRRRSRARGCNARARHTAAIASISKRKLGLASPRRIQSVLPGG